MNQKNEVVLSSLLNSFTTSSTTVGTVLDLSNYVHVGKRAIKLTISAVDCKLTTTTDQTLSCYWYQGDTTSTSLGSAVSGAAITTGTTAATNQEFNVLVTSRYIWAQGNATGTVPAWGVVANAIAIRRDF